MLRRKLLSASLFVSLAFLGWNCTTYTIRSPPVQGIQTSGGQSNPVDKYALLVSSASDLNSNYSKEGNDGDSIALFNIYKTLIKSGFPDEHIFILYSAQGRTPNFDAGNAEIADRVRAYHFSGEYDTTASEKNIEAILSLLKKRADDNDKFVFYIAAHGRKDGFIQLEVETRIYPYEFQGYLEDWKSKSNWFIIMSCYSGKLVDILNADNACLFSGTQSDKMAWIDENWCGGERFLKEKTNLKNDENLDGIVNGGEAFKKVQNDSVDYWRYLSYYLQRHYKGDKGWAIWDICLQPKIKVGKNFKETNL